jgi:hypothetical protein
VSTNNKNTGSVESHSDQERLSGPVGRWESSGFCMDILLVILTKRHERTRSLTPPKMSLLQILLIVEQSLKKATSPSCL